MRLFVVICVVKALGPQGHHMMCVNLVETPMQAPDRGVLNSVGGFSSTVKNVQILTLVNKEVVHRHMAQTKSPMTTAESIE